MATGWQVSSLALSAPPGGRELEITEDAEETPWRRARPLPPIFLPGEAHGQGSLAGTVHGVAQSPTEAT